MDQMKNSLVSYEESTTNDNPEGPIKSRHISSVNNDERYVVENVELYEGLLKNNI